jgi:signal transduction histidine kinase
MKEPTAGGLLGSVTDGVYALDDDWRFTYINPAAERLLGASSDELVGEVAWETDAIDAETEEALRRSKNTGEVAELKYSQQGEGMLVRTYPSESGLTVLVFDTGEVSDKDRLNRQLILVNRILRHDIRNDMNIILGWAENLNAEVGPEGEDALKRITDVAQHTHELTVTARDFIEVVTSEDAPDVTTVPLRETVEKEVGHCRNVYDESVTFSVEDVPQVGVRADSFLSSVLGNILSNAVEHNDKDEPRVEVGFETDGDVVRIRIADNGPGVPEDRRDDIFGRGERGLESPSSGLGLYLVDTVVRGYDGNVYVEDNQPEGSVFVVELRRADSAGGSDDV